VGDCGAVQQDGQQQVRDDVYLRYAEASALAIVVFDGQPTPAKWKTFLLERNRPAGPRRPGRRLAVHDSSAGSNMTVGGW